MLDKSKLYYLCHPYTTHGDKEGNKIEAIEIEKILQDFYGIRIINPLALIECEDNDKAMRKCLNLLSACDSIILCDNWNKSSGCKDEVSFSIGSEKEILLLSDITKEYAKGSE